MQYMFILLAFCHVIGATWVHKFHRTAELYSRKATVLLAVCYFIPLLVTGLVHYIDSSYMVYTAIGLFIWMVLAVIALKFLINHETGRNVPKGEYLFNFVCYGC